MNFIDRLFESQVITDKILSLLDAKSLALFGSTSTKWRALANSDIFWKKLCGLKKYHRFEYLIQTESHPSVPTKVISTPLPTYVSREQTQLDRLGYWRQVFNRAEHLLKNWLSGVYFVAPQVRGHKGKISAFDSNDSFMVSGGSDDRMIKVWSIDELECLSAFKVKSDSINCLKIHKDLVIAGGEAGNVKIYEISSGDVKHVLSSHSNNGSINEFLVSNEKLVAVFSDKAIRVWTLTDMRLNFILRGHAEEIESIACYEDALLSGSWDNLVMIWDLNNGAKIATLEGHSEVVNCLAIKNYNYFVSGSGDHTLKVWHTSISHKLDETKNNAKLVVNVLESKALTGHQSDVYCVDTCGEYIASGDASSEVIIWNSDGRLLHKLLGHLGVVRFVFIDQFKVVSSGDAKKIMVWDYRKGQLLNTLHRNPNKVSMMHVSDTKIISVSPEADSSITVICYW